MATVNLRDYPDKLHKEAKAKAALEWISMKDLFVKAVEDYLRKKVTKKWLTGYAFLEMKKV